MVNRGFLVKITVITVPNVPPPWPNIGVGTPPFIFNLSPVKSFSPLSTDILVK